MKKYIFNVYKTVIFSLIFCCQYTLTQQFPSHIKSLDELATWLKQTFFSLKTEDFDPTIVEHGLIPRMNLWGAQVGFNKSIGDDWIHYLSELEDKTSPELRRRKIMRTIAQYKSHQPNKFQPS